MRRLWLVPLACLAAAPCTGRADDLPEGLPPLFAISPTPPLGFSPPEQCGERLSLYADYLYWWLRRLRTPPLLTAGPPGSEAILGEPGTQLLRGGDRITSRHDRYVGVRFGAAYWLDPCRTWGIEGDAFFLERDSTHLTVPPGVVPVLALPFTGPQGTPSSFVISGFNPALGNLSGGTTVYSRMELFGQQANGVCNLVRSSWGEWDLLGGVRFLQLRERLDLTSTARVLPAATTLLGLEDHFQTFDKFYGGQLGTKGKLIFGRLSLEARATVALGADDEDVRNKGQSILQTPQRKLVLPHGLFVLPSNTGSFSRVAFGVVTEARLTVAYELARHVRLRAGYSVLTWDGPVRPGDQVGPLNLSQVVPGGLRGPLLPLPRFKQDLFWAQGLNTGIEFCW
jgi:hypothetical protein